jgi:hypothetical protein
MPRGKLNEIYVQQIAVKWLTKRYQSRSDVQAIVSGLEARINKNSPLGRGRADGLIAAQLLNGAIYTVSIEAKSSRTWKAINVQHLYERMLLHAAIFAVLFTLALLLLGITTTQAMFLEVIFPIIAITVAGFCVINFSQLGIGYRETEVVKQAERYPANEKWIALSTDIYNRLVNENQSDHFEKICLKSGIGLIRVTSSTKCHELVQPKAIPTPKNLDSFLVCYAREQVIRDQIALTLREPNIISATLVLDEPERSNVELTAEVIAEFMLNTEAEETSS